MLKEADVIIFQTQDDKLDLFDSKNWIRPIEIGLGDPKDREEAKTHYRIEQEIKRKLNKNIIKRRIRGLLWIDENKKLNISLDDQYYKRFDKWLDNPERLKYFQEMLERYKIDEVLFFDENENPEIFQRMEKIVLDAQTKGTIFRDYIKQQRTSD